VKTAAHWLGADGNIVTLETWYTADLHLGHANVIGYCARPFGSVDDMDEALLSAWNETVAVGDVVWVLGDLAMGRVEDSLGLAALLNGHKRLLAGNHDRVFRGSRRKPEAWIGRYEQAGFELHHDTVTLDLGERRVIGCHFPYAGDSGSEDR